MFYALSNFFFNNKNDKRATTSAVLELCQHNHDMVSAHANPLILFFLVTQIYNALLGMLGRKRIYMVLKHANNEHGPDDELKQQRDSRPS